MEPIYQSQWCRISNRSDSEADIFIEGTIGGDFWDAFFGGESTEENYKIETKEALRNELQKIRELGASKINVYINSYGGDVNHALSMHDQLKAHKAEVTTIIEGMSASSATIIAQAGDTRRMSENALYLIHNVRSGVFGSLNQMQDELDNIRRVNDSLVNLYVKRTGQDENTIRDLMNEGNGEGIWLTADEAKEYNLIDDVNDAAKVAAVSNSILRKHGLPKIKNQNNLMDKVIEGFSVKLDALTAKVEAYFGSKEVEATTEPESDTYTVTEEDVTTIKNELAVLTEEVENENTSLKSELTAKDSEIEALAAEVAELKNKLGIKEAAPVAPVVDEVEVGEPTVKAVDPASAIVNDVFAGITDSDRRLAPKRK